MNYKAEKTEKNQLRVTIELNKAEWTESNKAAYEKNKAKYSAPGFRKGHVPYSYLVNAYGEQIFFEDAINDAFSKHYFSILDKEAEYKVIDGPSIEDIKPAKDGGMVIIALAPLKPDVKLGAYKGIKIEKVEYNVTDEDVDKEVEKLRERNAREIEVTDRAVMDGDIVDIDYSGSVDNEKFEGGTAEHQTLVIGSKTFIPGFEDQIIGMNIGGERDITVKFPDDYGAENLKGKVAVFAIKLHGIKVKELPELTDEFVKESVGEESVAAYKAGVKDGVSLAYGNGAAVLKSVYADDVLIGREVFDDNGALQHKIFADENGDFNRYQSYYPDGAVKIDAEISGSKIAGKVKEYYENGRIKSEYEIKNGALVGEYTTYRKNGNISYAETYKAGELLTGEKKVQAAIVQMKLRFMYATVKDILDNK